MPAMFTPWKLGSVEVPNRLMRSATWEGMADAEGRAEPRLVELLGALAKGGVGLVVTGYAYVLPEGQGLPGQTGIHTDDCVEPLAKVAEAIKQGGAKAVVQLAHAGGHTKSELIGRNPLGPTARFNQATGEQVEELSADQLAEIIDAFEAGARRVKQAGFDAVQLHSAHGYLLSQFLSPNTNLREDGYGGSTENRLRFVMETYQAVRRAVGDDFPVYIKMNFDDGLEDGLKPAEALEMARALVAAGMDAIEVSGGIAGGGKPHKNGPGRMVKGPEQEGYFLDNALALKKMVDCPVISVGGWRSPERIEQALESLDAVAISRPFIREPGLARRWREGDLRPATCISCGQCLLLGAKGGIACGQDLKK